MYSAYVAESMLMFRFRCRTNVDFSIKVAWLLGAYSVDVRKPNWRNSQGVKLRKMILSDELRYCSFVHHVLVSFQVSQVC